MIAAIYARKPTGQHRRAEEAKSITGQIEDARAYAARQGWSVGDAHVYVDDGISGAEFEGRAGLVALLAALKPRAPFAVLVVYDKDRLGREQFETGVHPEADQPGRRQHPRSQGLGPRDCASIPPIDKIVMSDYWALAAEMEREKARVRTRDALRRKAERGYVTGGKCFGYGNVVINDESGRRSHVVRQVNADGAAVVRRIFTRAAEGLGLRKLVHQLNAEGTPAPTPRRAGGPRGVGAVEPPRDTPSRSLPRRHRVGPAAKAGQVGQAARHSPRGVDVDTRQGRGAPHRP